MWPDEEVVFARAIDESRSERDRIESLRADFDASNGTTEGFRLDGELVRALSMFELHGATLRRLADWYPNDARVWRAAQEWDVLQRGVKRSVRLKARLPKEARSLFTYIDVAH